MVNPVTATIACVRAEVRIPAVFPDNEKNYMQTR